MRSHRARRHRGPGPEAAARSREVCHLQSTSQHLLSTYWALVPFWALNPESLVYSAHLPLKEGSLQALCYKTPPKKKRDRKTKNTRHRRHTTCPVTQRGAGVHGRLPSARGPDVLGMSSNCLLGDDVHWALPGTLSHPIPSTQLPVS